MQLYRQRQDTVDRKIAGLSTVVHENRLAGMYGSVSCGDIDSNTRESNAVVAL